MHSNHPIRKRIALAAIALCLPLTSANALSILPDADIPVPVFREDALRETNPAVLREIERDATAGDFELLKAGLSGLKRGDLTAALRSHDSLPEGSLDHQTMSWAIALGGGAKSSAELLHAIAELEGWPGMITLQIYLERALYNEEAPADFVIDALQGKEPRTQQGVFVLARALLATGKKAEAAAIVSAYWRQERLEAKDEADFLREFSELLTQADHRARMEQMLHYDRVSSAQRVAKRAEASELAEAWGAVIRREGRAKALLQKVPEAQRGAGYVFAQARRLRWARQYEAAADAILEAPADAAFYVDPDAWWTERRVLSRELIDIGKPELAYKVAAAHVGGSPVAATDAAFHAGWYALRHLDDPQKATAHFQAIVDLAEGPISLSRGYYWLGRAAEAGAVGDARALFDKAALYSTSFYGQLAAARIGSELAAAAYPEPSAEERSRFAERGAVRAIERIEAAGYPDRADVLYRSLAEELDSPGELALLSAKAEKRSDHNLALRVGKIAAARGINVGALAHPVGVIPPSADISAAGEALAYAVARQESEFNVSAVSPAGARGLLQLLPRTARSMARRAGLRYSAGRLTSDPGYNATLGAAFLGDQLSRFDGSYVLTLAGYNAGPARAQDWMKRYGDPRGTDIDTVVDWIERIPFTETRNYVQRVMESFQVYKMRLSGRLTISDDLIR
jgi:soluble lytic murein transglycosylase